jgi:hypothetical protein
MVSLSILAFLPLQIPQIWSNAVRIGTADPAVIEDLRVIPVLGYGAGMVANLLLMCYLADRRERWGSLVQMVGIVTSGVVVTQLFWAGFVDPVLYSLLVTGCLVGIGFNLGRLWIPPVEEDSIIELRGETLGFAVFQRAWFLWKNGLNLLGLTLFPSLLTIQLQQSFLPALSLQVGVSLSLCVLVLGSITLIDQHLGTPLALGIQPLAWFQRYWGSISGWTANLLFMFGPAAQLVQNFLHPDSIIALSLTTQGLSVLGNLLILARSGTLWLQGQDRVWAVGGLWEVTVRGLVFGTIAYFGFMPWLWVALYGTGVVLYGLWIYGNVEPLIPPQKLERS